MSIAQIIKYEGDNSTFVWKHPSEDFNTSTQLIVHESQEAIFFMNGQALDLFGAGRYTLETENIPLIRKVANLPTGGQTPFHCEVYFINKTEQMAIRWGTDSKVQYLEPTYKFPISIGASGEMSLSVSDSRKLLIKLVGTEAFLGQAKLIQFFRAFLMTRVKTYIAQTMAANAINIFEADAHLTEFSEELHKRLIPDFADYLSSMWVQVYEARKVLPEMWSKERGLKMKKDSVKGYALIGIIFILITVVSLAIPTSKSAAFWIAYIFTVVALAAQIVLWKRTFGHKELKSKFLVFPIVHIGIMYLVVQIAVLFIFVFAEKLPAWSALVTCTVIAAMAAIFMIAADVGRTEIEKVEQKVQGKVFYIKNLQVDIEILASAEKDTKTKEQLEQLAEKIRFSDPMSNEQLAVLEDKISLAVENLKSSDDKMKIIEDLNLLLDERNRKCKILK